MIRILLPLAVVAAMYFGPFYSETTVGSATGARNDIVDGRYFINNAVNCVIGLNFADFAFGEECASDAEFNESKMTGSVLSGAAKLSLVAAVLGVIGVIPFVGRVTSVATIIAGLAVIGAVGYFMLAAMSLPEGLGGVGWGAYLTGGAGLLTLISGLSGLRGR
ncbi:MAG: hypothetical protein ACX939_03480 [Hyphococcus sp.]